MTHFKSGYVAVVGRPNVGKSTLINHLLGTKVSITTPKPQTTRWHVLGIQNLSDAQIVYVDTPGIHKQQKRAMNRYLNRIAESMLHDADIIAFIVDATRWTEEDDLVVEKLKNASKPILLVVNKVDLLDDKALLLPLIERLQSKLSFTHIIPISALRNEQLDVLEKEIIKLLPEGPQLFPEDQITDKSAKFQVAEIIREKVIQATEDELPYTTTVEIEQWKTEGELTEISAIIWVERDGQKGIIIGKAGKGLRRIGTLARRDIERMVSGKVYLRLWVKVKENWTDNDKALRGLGYE